MKENDIQNSICEYLELRKHFFWRNNTVGVYDSTTKGYRRMPRYAMKGVPDILLVYKSNIYGLEVKNKTPKGYQSKDQKEFEEFFEKAGGIYRVVRSIEDVVMMGL